MPSESASQQRLMGLALSVKRGKTKLSSLPQELREKVKKIVDSMSEEQIRDFAKKKAMVITDTDPEYVTINAEMGKPVTFRKQILKAGKFAHAQKPDKTINYNEKLFSQIKKAFDEKVIDNVLVIVDTHDETVDKTVGRVVDLEYNKKGMWAMMEVVDKEVVEGITTKLSDGKGLIDEVSVSLASVYKDNGDLVPVVLMHVAIVPHAFYRGMDSFELVKAMLNEEYVVLNSVLGGDLQQHIHRVRQSYRQVNPTSMRWVEEVHEKFVIVFDESDGSYIKVPYTVSKDKVTFGDSVKVQKQFVEAQVENKDLLKAINEFGFEFKSIDDIKAKLSEKPTEPKKEKEIDVDKIKAVLVEAGLIQKDEKKVDVQAAVNALAETVKTQGTTITTLQGQLLESEAKSSVDALAAAGKVLPAQVEHYKKLFKTDKEMFTGLTATLPVVVEMGEKGAASKDEGTKITEPEKVNAEVKRIRETHKVGDLSTNGRNK